MDTTEEKVELHVCVASTQAKTSETNDHTE